jgi:hypothetical protein
MMEVGESWGRTMDESEPDDSDEPEREYWLVRVLKFIGNLIVAAFIHSTP